MIKGKSCCGGTSKCSCEDLRTHILKLKRKQRKTDKPKIKEGSIKRKGKGKEGKRRRKQKNLHKLTKGDLKNLLRTLEVQSGRPNPKCVKKGKDALFKNKRKYVASIPIELNCIQPCRKKDPIPVKKKYKQRTLELGLFTDKAIYTQMAVRISLFEFCDLNLVSGNQEN